MDHCKSCSSSVRQSHTILSMPRGPRLVLTASATAFAASMLDVLTSDFFALSLRDYYL